MPLPNMVDLEMGPLELSEERGPSEEREKSEIINELRAELADKDKQLVEKENQLVEKDKQLAEMKAEKEKQLAENEKQLVEKDNQLAEKDKQLAENDKQLAEKDQLAELNTENDQLAERLVEFIHNFQQTSVKGNYMQKICALTNIRAAIDLSERENCGQSIGLTAIHRHG